ncbi:MAG: S41 family peptidase [Candidatus Berkelbacteria bacterium]
MEKIKKLTSTKKFIKITILILFSLIFFSVGYLIGHKNLIFEKNFKPKLVNQEIIKSKTVDFAIFWKVWDLVLAKSVDKPDMQKMVYGAISGMLGSMGDPYSIFMEPSLSKAFMEDLSGEIQGIGAEISIRDSKLIVVSPLAGSPAEKAGLKPGDQIGLIDDKIAADLTLQEAITHIRGNAGTKVKLTIMRDGWSEPKVFEIQREKIAIKSVSWQVRDDNIGYIKVNQFGDDTNSLMNQAVSELSGKNVKAVILDLRHNPGGYLDSAVDMVGLFSNKGTIVVKEKDKDGKIQTEATKLDPIMPNTKLIVLIDEGSASASEIVAGALQDNGRATLVGQKSFGKGSVQEMQDLGKGASLKLTIAKWLTPKDREIDHRGIEPDVKISLTEDDQKTNRDPQLDKAVELAR